VTITDKIDIPQIIEHGDEFEIAKVIAKITVNMEIFSNTHAF